MRCWFLNGKGEILLLAAAVLLSPACAEKRIPSEKVLPPARPVTASVQPEVKIQQTNAPAPSPRSYKQIGIASWFGKEFHGQKTASGEIYDMFGMSARHRTLPLGTMIRVTNLDNFKSITVKVIDRGPFSGNTILELSYGAARELGFVAQGTARVEIEAPDQLWHAPGLYSVQAAVFSEEESARSLKDRLSAKYESILILPFETNSGTFYRVRVGSYGTEEKAEAIARKLKLEGLEPLVLRKD